MICVDASVAVKWVLPEERSDLARALFVAAIRAAEPIVAPPLLPIEVTNIIYKRVRGRDGMPVVAAQVVLHELLTSPVELVNPAGLHRDALALAADLQLSAAYDAHYLALARHVGCDLWTDDRRLVRQAGDVFPFVRWIGDLGSLPAAPDPD